MAVNNRRVEPEVFIEGIDVVIKLDLGKHKELLSQATADVAAFQNAAAHESAKKRHYFRQIGLGKFDDESLRSSVEDIRVNIRHLTDKAILAQQKVEHHRHIVDTLTKQLEEYDKRYASLH